MLDKRTYFIVAVSDGKFTHNSLQLSINKHWYMDDEQGRVVVTHNGTMSRKGSYPTQDVLGFVAKSAPELIESKRIMLGDFPTDRLIEWEDARELITNLCVYGLLRDKARVELTCEDEEEGERYLEDGRLA